MGSSTDPFPGPALRQEGHFTFSHVGHWTGLSAFFTGLLLLRRLHLAGGAQTQTGTSSLKSTQLAHIPSLAPRVMTYLVIVFSGPTDDKLHKH